MAFKSDNIFPGNGARVLLKVVSVNGSRAIVQYPDGFQIRSRVPSIRVARKRKNSDSRSRPGNYVARSRRRRRFGRCLR